mgnify:CR=1 FL=1
MAFLDVVLKRGECLLRVVDLGQAILNLMAFFFRLCDRFGIEFDERPAHAKARVVDDDIGRGAERTASQVVGPVDPAQTDDQADRQGDPPDARQARLKPDGKYLKARFFTPEEIDANQPKWVKIYQDVLK